MLQLIAAVLLPTLVSFFFYYSYFHKKTTVTAPLPPGPKPLPIVGNIFDLPPKGTLQHEHWLRFKDKYGPISYVNVLGLPLVLLHDRQMTHEILEKVSTKTSGRPRMEFASVLCGFEVFLSFMQYDSTFRQHRKLVHQHLGTKSSVVRFREVQDLESHRLLYRILDNPEGLRQHIKTEASAIILQITYGYSVDPQRPDPLVLIIEQMMSDFSSALVPMKWAVDVLPILKYLPESFAGVPFKSIAREVQERIRLVLETPYAFVRQQMNKGLYRPSYVSAALESDNHSFATKEDLEDAIRRTAAVMYAGGADTTVSSIISFVLAMTLFPEVQQKAQQEIDTVVGMDRLPQFEDRDNLSYVNAVVKETMRWLPVVPGGVSHLVDEEFVYGGFRIPKGAYLQPAIWWYLHNPSVYPDPESFDPERYLEPRCEPDPASEAFGYGRRICPGKYLADESMFLTIARLLAVFKFTKAVDQHGKEIEPEIKIENGLIGRPLDFPYDIKPRNAKCIELIKSVETQHLSQEGDSGLLTDEFKNYTGREH